MPTDIPTTHDIAQRAGVSRTTVSFVLNNVPVKLQPATREKVLAAARELGYVPNSVARALKTGQTNTIALINPNLSDPFFSEFADLFWHAANEAGYRVSISNGTNIHGPSSVRPQDLHELIAQRVDGILLHNVDYPRITPDLPLPQLGSSPVPVVMVRQRETSFPICPSIVFDLEVAGQLAAHHLLEHGRRNFLFVGHNDSRLAGFRDTLHEAGLDPHIIICNDATDPDCDSALHVLSQRPAVDAVLAGNDMIALRLFGMLQSNGLRIPDDVALMGIGDIALCTMLYPALTSVSLRRAECVSHAMAMLTTLTGGDELPEQHIVLQPRLIARASTVDEAS